jgi:hypothetical protein
MGPGAALHPPHCSTPLLASTWAMPNSIADCHPHISLLAEQPEHLPCHHKLLVCLLYLLLPDKITAAARWATTPRDVSALGSCLPACLPASQSNTPTAAPVVVPAPVTAQRPPPPPPPPGAGRSP